MAGEKTATARVLRVNDTFVSIILQGENTCRAVRLSIVQGSIPRVNEEVQVIYSAPTPGAASCITALISQP